MDQVGREGGRGLDSWAAANLLRTCKAVRRGREGSTHGLGLGLVWDQNSDAGWHSARGTGCPEIAGALVMHARSCGGGDFDCGGCLK